MVNFNRIVTWYIQMKLIPNVEIELKIFKIYFLQKFIILYTSLFQGEYSKRNVEILQKTQFLVSIFVSQFRYSILHSKSVIMFCRFKLEQAFIF